MKTKLTIQISGLLLGFSILPTELFASNILFQDQFNMAPRPENPPWTWVRDSQNGGLGALDIVADAGDYFQNGTSHNVLRWHKDTTGTPPLSLQANNVMNVGVATFSFNFYEPASVYNDWVDLWVYSGSILGANSVQRFQMGRGALGVSEPAYRTDFGQDTLVRFDFVVNNSGETLVYGDNISLETNHADVWINGVLARAAWQVSNNQSGLITGFQFNTVGSGRQLAYIDDFVVREGAFVIPEPSTTGFLAATGALLLVMLRRRRS